MSAYLSYQIEVALLLIAFYLCFKCFLSRERMHRVNRIIIILTSVLSFILPLCVITVHKVVSVPSAAEVTAVAAPDSVTSQIEAVTLSWEAGLKPVDPLEAARNVPKDRRHQLRINANDKVLYDATPIDAGNLCGLVAESIRANHQSVICIQMNTATSYGAYISAIKDLDEAVNQVRDEYSKEHYGKSLVELDDTARAAVLKEIPRTILELDPKNN